MHLERVDCRNPVEIPRNSAEKKKKSGKSSPKFVCPLRYAGGQNPLVKRPRIEESGILGQTSFPAFPKTVVYIFRRKKCTQKFWSKKILPAQGCLRSSAGPPRDLSPASLNAVESTVIQAHLRGTRGTSEHLSTPAGEWEPLALKTHVLIQW